MQRLQDRVAVITGGGSGIGLATARRFAEEGAKVVVADLDEDTGKGAADEIGGLFVRADVTREDEIRNAIHFARDAFCRLDVLFNNAGGGTKGSVDSFTAEDLDNAIKLLLSSVLYGMKHAVPIMKAQGWGAIINNSSVAALRTHMSGYLY